MGGAYVMVLGMDIVTTPKSDLEDCGNLVRFFESTDFNRMSPADDLRFAGTQYVLAQPGASYIAYASQLRGEMGLKNMSSGRYNFLWFDCATGKRIIQQEVSVAAGGQSWAKPSGIGGEIAVYVRHIAEQ
jgi:hypothetical protein